MYLISEVVPIFNTVIISGYSCHTFLGDRCKCGVWCVHSSFEEVLTGRQGSHGLMDSLRPVGTKHGIIPRAMGQCHLLEAGMVLRTTMSLTEAGVEWTQCTLLASVICCADEAAPLSSGIGWADKDAPSALALAEVVRPLHWPLA